MKEIQPAFVSSVKTLQNVWNDQVDGFPAPSEVEKGHISVSKSFVLMLLYQTADKFTVCLINIFNRWRFRMDLPRIPLDRHTDRRTKEFSIHRW